VDVVRDRNLAGHPSFRFPFVKALSGTLQLSASALGLPALLGVNWHLSKEPVRFTNRGAVSIFFKRYTYSCNITHDH
jgi:hypothetical protein